MKRTIYISLLIFLLLLCKPALLRKKKVREWNILLENKIYILKVPIKLNELESLEKGLKLKIYIESTKSIIKVKGYLLTEDRENVKGRLITYIINHDFTGKKFDQAELDKLIAPFLEEDKNKKKSSR